MSIEVWADGTHTGTTSFVALPSADNNVTGAFQFIADLSALQLGDEIVIQIFESALAAGTPRAALTATITHYVDESLWVSPTLVLLHKWTFQIKQTTGTGRSIPWSIRRII